MHSDENKILHIKLAAHLKNMLNDSIWCAEQVNTRDAANICLHSARRQVLLPQTWNQHAEHHVQGRGAILMLHRAQPQYRGGRKTLKQDTS